MDGPLQKLTVCNNAVDECPQFNQHTLVDGFLAQAHNTLSERNEGCQFSRVIICLLFPTLYYISS